MPKQIKDWQCLECGRKMTLRAAERATSTGCPKCGGVDIDLVELDRGRSTWSPEPDEDEKRQNGDR